MWAGASGPLRTCAKRSGTALIRNWFHLSFDGNTEYNDGFWYEGWEGHNELVKLNLNDPAVVDHLFAAVKRWVEEYGIDGLRLDVAYCLSPDFLAKLRGFTDSLKPEFVLMGETLHGDYNRWMNDHACHSVTNYECYKGLYSSFNSMNMFEIGHSLTGSLAPNRGRSIKASTCWPFWTTTMWSASPASLRTPPTSARPTAFCSACRARRRCITAASGARRAESGTATPPCAPRWRGPQNNELTEWVAALAAARASSPALCEGDYRTLALTNRSWCSSARRAASGSSLR